MLFHTSIASFVAYFLLLSQPTSKLAEEVELIPVDAGFEDRGALSESFRVEQVDLRHDTAFETLYKVSGSDGVYVRKAGGLRAVFKNPTYFDTANGAIPLLPAGTVYSIGEVNVSLLGQLSTLSTVGVSDERVVPQRYIAGLKPAPITTRRTPRGVVRFIDDEEYRRERLTSLVLGIILSDRFR
jgi:hypothetical protein